MISQRDIVLLTFPFSDLRSVKVRPAIVLSNNQYNRNSEDFIAVPLTSNLRPTNYSILITNNELERGNLIVNSRVKVDRVFSVSQRLVRMKIGIIRTGVHRSITAILMGLVHAT
jgi:mRNA interferase MazF